VTSTGTTHPQAIENLTAQQEAFGVNFFASHVTRSANREAMKRYYTLSAISLVLLIIDQASKLYVDANFRLHETVPVIRGFFHLTYVRNKGAAFGILSDNAIRIPFFITVSIIAMLGSSGISSDSEKTKSWPFLPCLWFFPEPSAT